MIAALHYRNRTGKGQLVDLGLAENVLHVLGTPFLDYTMNRRVGERLGNRHPHAAPHGCYRARGDDRWVTIAVTTDEEWQGFCAALGNPAWTGESRFSDAASRWSNQDAIDTFVEAWTQDLDPYDIMHRLQAHDVPAGPVMDAADCYNDPNLEARGYFEKVSHPEAGTHQYPGMFFKFSETKLSIRRHTPLLGEDNAYVYKDLLQYTDVAWDELVREGHIGMDFAPHVP